MAILIGVDSPNAEWTLSESLSELSELARTAGVTVVTRLTQSRTAAHPSTYLGSGKLIELKELLHDTCANIVIADDELTPAQLRNIERALQVKILDRTGLILDIFALRARSAESQLQIELAQLTYSLPRLTRMWTHLSRLGGGVGTRGPGEKQLEVDKRQIRKRISVIKEKIDKIRVQRVVQRDRRFQVPLMSAAIIGYTNAGKSTLLNRLTQSDVLAEDLLFATLDPTTRSLKLPSSDQMLITDTVGFIQKLPHQLVSSFQTTLEEVTQADILLHVVDSTNPRWQDMVSVVNDVVAQLGAGTTPQIMIFNKIDALPDGDWPRLQGSLPHCHLSGITGQRLETLLMALDTHLASFRQVLTIRIPYQRMDIVHQFHEYGQVQSVEYESDIKMVVDINRVVGERLLSSLHHQEAYDE